MFYFPEDDSNVEESDVDSNSFDGPMLGRDIKHLAKRIASDNENTLLLKKESFVIAIQGGWGTGKTTAAFTLLNELRKQQGFNKPDMFYQFRFDLLPFGNITESVGNILANIADKLWQEGVVDVRREFRQFAIDATPNTELDASVQALGVTLTRKFTISSRSADAKIIVSEKFKKLTQGGYRFAIILDDLDRMEPEEVIIVLRMIEGLKSIPGIIIVLPFFRAPIANAVHTALGIDELSAHAFLRRFIKSTITIDLTLENLKSSFLKYVDFREYGKLNSVINHRVGMNTDELLWYILMHLMLVRDTITVIGSDVTGQNVNANYRNSEASTYLYELPELLDKSRKPQQNPGQSTFPYNTDNKWKRFADVYGFLADSSNANETLNQLKGLMSEDLLANDLYTDAGLIDELRQIPEIDFDEPRSRELANKTVFEVICLPLLKETTHEPKITEYYSRRDMEQLAKAIYNDPDFRLHTNAVRSLKNLIYVTRKIFLEFR